MPEDDAHPDFYALAERWAELPQLAQMGVQTPSEEASLARAQVYATLALAREQRIANLIALHEADTSSAGIPTSVWPGVRGVLAEYLRKPKG